MRARNDNIITFCFDMWTIELSITTSTRAAKALAQGPPEASWLAQTSLMRLYATLIFH